MNNNGYDEVLNSVRTYFKTNKAAVSYMELVALIRIARKQKGFLKRALEEMTRNGELICKRRRYSSPPYRINRPVQPVEPSVSNPKLIEGIFDATPLSRDLSFAFVRTAQADYYINSEDTLNAFHNDQVAIEIKTSKGREEHGVVRRIIKRANTLMAGDILFDKFKTIFISSNPKIHKWFEVTDAGMSKKGDKVILEVSNWGSPLQGKMPSGKVTEVLGPSGDPQVELIAVIRQYGLPLEFGDDVLNEVNSLSEEIDARDLVQREDLRNLFTFTIDPASAKDFDDAISLEKDKTGIRLWVHIADVSHYVQPGSATFGEAAKRGNSFYFPKKVIPMLPEKLSNQVCSLRPDEDKLCLTVFTQFDIKGRIKAQKLIQSVIRSDHRLSYEQVDELFETGKSELEPELVTALLYGRELSLMLSQKRIREGYISFDLPEVEYEYDEEGFLHKLGLSDETESHKLIENFMLVANEYVAERLSLLSPISMYRIHEDPEPHKLQKLNTLISQYGLQFIASENLNVSLQYLLNSMPNEDYHKVFDRMVLRSMKKAKYSTEHKRHFGLGIQYYTHFTSPIRRLCDLSIHHLCKAYMLKTTKPALDKKQITLYAETASNQELLADEAERDIERIYALAYMKKRIGERYHGMIISAKSSALIVRLDEIPVTAVLKISNLPGGPWSYNDNAMSFVSHRTNQTYRLMDKVIVEIDEVSDDIYIILAKVQNAHTPAYILPAKTTPVRKTNPGERKPQGKKSRMTPPAKKRRLR